MGKWIDMGLDCALFSGDCLDGLADLPKSSVDIVLTDPPYGLNFMGKNWDHGIPGKHFWREILHVSKPGATLMAFGGTRTYHRLTCAIEDAGWEIRDCLMWLYGMGFPKSFDISKGMDRAVGAEREVVGRKYIGSGNKRKPSHDYGRYDGPEDLSGLNVTIPSTPNAQLWDGYGTALKPAWEPIVLAMKPLDGTFAQNAIKWGVAGLNISGSRIRTSAHEENSRKDEAKKDSRSIFFENDNEQPRGWDGSAGRFPANLLLAEEAARLLDEQSGISKGKASPANNEPTGADSKVYGWATYSKMHKSGAHYGGEGGASRFFYTSKASRSERNRGCDDFYWKRDKSAPCGHVRISLKEWERLSENERAQGNIHTTIKPLSLMAYLCKLVRTPFGGVVLDPFAGSCSTGCSALDNGMQFIGMDNVPEYIDISQARIRYHQLNRS